MEARAATDEQDTHEFFELLDSGRQGRLRNAAGLRGAAKMLLAGQRHEKFKLIDQWLTLGDGVISRLNTSIEGLYQ